MAGKSPQSAYLATQVRTASKEQLLLMLFDGAVKFAHQAKAAIERRDIGTASENAVKVQKIIAELMSSLDKEIIAPELYTNLMSLYNFCHKRMVSANLERNAAHVDEVIAVLYRLRETWKEAIDKVLQQYGGRFPSENEVLANEGVTRRETEPAVSGPPASIATTAGGVTPPGLPAGPVKPAAGKSAFAPAAGKTGSPAAPAAAPRPASPAPAIRLTPAAGGATPPQKAPQPPAARPASPAPASPSAPAVRPAAAKPAVPTPAAPAARPAAAKPPDPAAPSGRPAAPAVKPDTPAPAFKPKINIHR